jgi:hypothetical protein
VQDEEAAQQDLRENDDQQELNGRNSLRAKPLQRSPRATRRTAFVTAMRSTGHVLPALSRPSRPNATPAASAA